MRIIDIKGGSEEKSFVWDSNHEESDAAKAEALDMTVNTRIRVRSCPEYQDVTDKIREMNQEEEEESEKKKKRKRRKVMKELRVFTGKRQDRERAFRGWSTRAYIEMTTMKDEIRADYERRRRFSIAVRNVLKLNKDFEDEDSETEGNENEAPVQGLYDDIPSFGAM
jgi:hypothetical protein